MDWIKEGLFVGAAAYIYRRLTRLRGDVPLVEDLDDLRWKGPNEDFVSFCETVGADDLPGRVSSIT